jgi:HNH endonuclease
MSATLRLEVRQRAGARCEYCQLPEVAPHLMRFHLEHIRARLHGGPSALSNLAWACARCNERKGANLSGVDSDTDRVVRLFNPRRAAWARHFVWIRGHDFRGDRWTNIRCAVSEAQLGVVRNHASFIFG